MPEFIITTLLGIVCIVLGVLNMKGNISTVHWYHRKRVSEENRLPFGRLVGFGRLLSVLHWLFLRFLRLSQQ